MKTRVVHCMKEPFDVYIGRPHPRFPAGSDWANPYPIGPNCSRERSLYLYEHEHLAKRPDLVARARVELKGRVLGCWCKPKHACHGDILARLADETENPGIPVQGELF